MNSSFGVYTLNFDSTNPGEAQFRMFSPPDAEAAFLAGLWIALPYLAAAGLALLFRRRNPALITLAACLGLCAFVGVSMLNASANQHDISQKEVENAVQPGEDPNSGPAGMRKSGADLGAEIGGFFSILICAVLPPLQLAVVVIPSTIVFAISSARRRREVEPETDDGEAMAG